MSKNNFNMLEKCLKIRHFFLKNIQLFTHGTKAEVVAKI